MLDGDTFPLLQVRITPLARESVCLAQFRISAPAVEEPAQRRLLEHVFKEPIDDPLLALPVRTTEESLQVRGDFADDLLRIGTEVLEVLESTGKLPSSLVAAVDVVSGVGVLGEASQQVVLDEIAGGDHPEFWLDPPVGLVRKDVEDSQDIEVLGSDPVEHPLTRDVPVRLQQRKDLLIRVHVAFAEPSNDLAVQRRRGAPSAASAS